MRGEKIHTHTHNNGHAPHAVNLLPGEGLERPLVRPGAQEVPEAPKRGCVSDG